MATPDSVKQGPGTIKFGSGLTQNPSLQVAECEVTPTEQVDRDEDIPTLTGDTLYGDETITYDWILRLVIIQAIGASSFIAWTWANAGTEQAFEFIPNTVGARKITGTVIITPSKIGGVSKKRNTAELTFRLPRGTAPALAAV